MPIQFCCESCNQPIEVDDDGAGQWVACPFCSQTRRAPTTSDVSLRVDVPVATPQGGFEQDAAGGGHVPAPEAGRRRCTLGWIALACLGVGVLSTCVQMPLVFSAQKTVGAHGDFQEIQKAVLNEQMAHLWAIAAGFVGTLTPMAALTLAIVSLVRRESPRWPAVATLVVSAGMVLLVCLGVIMGFAVAFGA